MCPKNAKAADIAHWERIGGSASILKQPWLQETFEAMVGS
jgi:hypothetical protein